MELNRKSSLLTIWMYAATALIALFGGSELLAANLECARSSPGPQICVFKNGTDPDPIPDEDFVIDFTDPLNPDITLMTGSDEWQVWGVQLTGR